MVASEQEMPGSRIHTLLGGKIVQTIHRWFELALHITGHIIYPQGWPGRRGCSKTSRCIHIRSGLLIGGEGGVTWNFCPLSYYLRVSRTRLQPIDCENQLDPVDHVSLSGSKSLCLQPRFIDQSKPDNQSPTSRHACGFQILPAALSSLCFRAGGNFGWETTETGDDGQ